MYGRPTMHAVAPSATAFTTSEPRTKMVRALGQMGVTSVADLDASCIETSQFAALKFSA